MWSWILWACREELVATAALGTSEGAAVPGGSTRAVREISFLVEPLDEAVRGSQPHHPPTPALGLLPLPGRRKLQGSCPGRQTPACRNPGSSRLRCAKSHPPWVSGHPEVPGGR